MPYSETQTLMMEVIKNLNNRIIPLHLPYEHESFLTSEVVNGLFDAISQNNQYKNTHSTWLSVVEPYMGSLFSHQIVYYPFHFPPDLEDTAEQLPFEFEFTLENTYAPDVSNLEIMNKAHKFFHYLGFNPYVRKSSYDNTKYIQIFYTNKDYFPSVNSYDFIREWYPCNFKIKKVTNVGETAFREAFGFPPHSGGYGGYLFKIGSRINLDNASKYGVKMFKAMQSMGFILRTPEGEQPLPYHNKPIYYCNPHYGYYDDFYSSSSFLGGGYDSNNKPNIEGFYYVTGFTVEWFTDSEFWISYKYDLVYQDKRPIQYDPTLCCLAQCFDITE